MRNLALHSFRAAAAIAVLSVILAAPLWGQTGSAGITGSVVDQSGAAIPNTKLTVVNEESGAKIETLSTEGGQYRVTSLLPGAYRLEIEQTGFEGLIRRGIVLTTGQVVVIDLALKVGATSETVTVEAAPPLTEAQTQAVGQLINRRMVAGLPMPNRAASSLVALAPGVVMIDPGQGAENYPVFSVAGGRGRNQHFSLDGGNATNASGLTRS
jgi:hypothetical protein